ncbi:hypothetical protein WJR50_00820 [Catalinimonas sp. 4WD22]|uniref:hypothetical protein n=1 Tax=Catalinimonas locisalis TaxID=3133978 RepID=UPI003100D06D
MNSFYSIIRFVSNQWSNENIAVGLLIVSSEKLFFKVSDRKLRLAKSLDSNAQKLFRLSIKQLEDFVEGEKKIIRESNYSVLPLEKSKLNQAFVERLHRYSKGILQFSSPELINKDFDESSFLKYYGKMVDASEISHKRERVVTEFHRKIENRLHDPLRERVDVNYSLKKESLPNLYFDYDLENIGVNGAVIASASIDLNHDRIDVLQKKLAEYETVVDRLKLFAKSKDIGGDHSFFLIADNYKGKTPSNMELDSLLKGGISNKFKRFTTSELDKIVKEVKKKKATKFSELVK